MNELINDFKSNMQNLNKSPRTIYNYSLYLEKMLTNDIITNTNDKITYILNNYNEYFKFLSQNLSNKSQEAYYNTFNMFLNIYPKYKQHYNYNNFINDYHKIIQSDFNNREENNLILPLKDEFDINDLKEYYTNDLYNNINNLEVKLILGLYIINPPIRNDYNKIYLFEDDNEYLEFSSENIVDKYIIIDKSLLFINSQHLKNKNLGDYKYILPNLLIDIVQQIYDTNQRLIFNYQKASMNKFVNSNLTYYFNKFIKDNKKLTINSIRHLYINDVSDNIHNMRTKDIKNMIKNLNQSKIYTFMNYRTNSFFKQ